MQMIYVDTSVFGGCFEEEFSEYSIQLINEFKRGKKKMMVSELVFKELIGANALVKRQPFVVPSIFSVVTKASGKAYALADSYIQKGVLKPESENDALHVAMATLQGADVIASWNFRHMVNAGKIKLFNKINNDRGFREISIKTPREILNP